MKSHRSNSATAVLLCAVIAFSGCASGVQENQANLVAPQDCAALAGLRLSSGGMVETATPIAAGERIALNGSPIGLPAHKAFCRVSIVLQPAEGSQIRSEVWLPADGEWNGKFMAAGNGGYAGSLLMPIIGMHRAMAEGYASAGTDSGHTAQAEDASWAHEQPVRVEDWAHRATHVTTEAARELIGVFYGRSAERSYFSGCSNGGREALIQAIRYPNDYDGIISGAPAAAWTEIMSGFVSNVRAVNAPGAQLSAENLQLIQRTALDRCDSLDGVQDGVIEHPPSCGFDPAELRCTSGNEGACLSDAQISAVRAIQQGPRMSDGRRLVAGYEPSGAALGWAEWMTGPTATQGRFGEGYFRWMVYDDPDWTMAQFDIDRDYARASATTGRLIDADNPNLAPFFRGGGKLLLYAGWVDPAISPQSTIDQYEAIRERVGASHRDDIRLFVAAGMMHCIGGPGPNVFDALGALDEWVATDLAPERMIATKYNNDLFGLLGFPATVERTRPICAWPRRVTYNGVGDVADAASFTCEAPH